MILSTNHDILLPRNTLTLFIAQITIKDPELYQQYIDGFYTVFNKYKGKILAVDNNPKPVEGDKLHTRIVVIRFPDETEFEKWYYSPEYQELAELRWKASDANIILVDERT